MNRRSFLLGSLGAASILAAPAIVRAAEWTASNWRRWREGEPVKIAGYAEPPWPYGGPKPDNAVWLADVQAWYLAYPPVAFDRDLPGHVLGSGVTVNAIRAI